MSVTELYRFCKAEELLKVDQKTKQKMLVERDYINWIDDIEIIDKATNQYRILTDEELEARRLSTTIEDSEKQSGTLSMANTESSTESKTISNTVSPTSDDDIVTIKYDDLDEDSISVKKSPKSPKNKDKSRYCFKSKERLKNKYKETVSDLDEILNYGKTQSEVEAFQIVKHKDYFIYEENIRDNFVSKEFRDYIFSLFTSLNSDHEHVKIWRRLVNWCFSTTFRQEDGRIVIPKKILQMMMDKDIRSENGISAIKLLKEFEENVFPLYIQGYRYSEGKATTIDPQFSQDLLIKILEEQEKNLKAWKSKRDDLVSFVDGHKISQRKFRDIKSNHIDDVNEAIKTLIINPSFKEFSSIVNRNTSKLMNQVINENCVANAIEYILDMPKSNEQELRSRTKQVDIMNVLLRNGFLTYYEQGESTNRFFAQGLNINQFKREIRKILLINTVELDLVGSQLSIAAKVFECHELEEFLKNNGNFWHEMCSYLKIELNNYNKKIIKDQIYSILFGMNTSNYRTLIKFGYTRRGKKIIRSFHNGLGRELGDNFLNHPFVKEVIAGRDKWFKDFKDKGYVLNRFDERIDYICWKGKEKTEDGKYLGPIRDNSKTALANYMTSYELYLMMAVNPIIQSERGISIISFLHDGMNIHCNDKYEEKRQVNRLINAVNERANEEGIYTYLKQEEENQELIESNEDQYEDQVEDEVEDQVEDEVEEADQDEVVETPIIITESDISQSIMDYISKEYQKCEADFWLVT